MHRILLDIIKVDFDVTGQLMIVHSTFVKNLRKHGNTTKQCVAALQNAKNLMIQ